MAINVDELRNGMDQMPGTYADGLNVSHRVLNELQKMDTSAQLLLQKKSLPKASMDLWSSIIKTLNERHNGFHQALISYPPEKQADHYHGWDDLKVLALDVARSSNQLQGELDSAGNDMVKLVAIGGAAILGLGWLANMQSRRKVNY